MNTQNIDNDLKEKKESIQELQDRCHNQARDMGWWNNIKTGKPKELTIELFLANLGLIHSEVSEALEGHRKNLMDDKLPHRKMDEVELADALIRILDLAGAYGLDIEGAVNEKLAFNKTRADHQLENRLKDGGKKA